MKLLFIWPGVLLLAACSGLGPSAPQAVAQAETALPPVWYAPPLPHQGQTAALNDWWARLGDERLPTLIAQAQQASASIDAARAQFASARAALAGADSSDLQLGLAAGAYRGVSASAPLGTGMNAGLQASWTIDLWGQNASAVRQAAAQAQAAQAGWHEARVLVAAQTARLYLGWRACLAQRQVNEADLVSRQATARRAADTERAGLLAPATAALARAAAADAQARVALQARQCEQQFKALVAMTGVPETALRQSLGSSADLPDPLPSGQALVVPAVPMEAIRQRPDVARAQQELVAAADGVGVARAALWPSLSLTGNVLRNRFTTAGESTSFTSWSVGPLALNLPLLGRGGLQASADASVVRYEAAASAYAQVLRQSVAEVEQALVALDALRVQLDANRQAVDGYARSFQGTEARYRVGLADLGELEEARRVKLAADSAAVALQYEHIDAWIALYLALGGGFDPHIAPAPARPVS